MEGSGSTRTGDVAKALADDRLGEIMRLRVVLRGLLDCHPTREHGYPECGYVTEARRLLDGGNGGPT